MAIKMKQLCALLRLLCVAQIFTTTVSLAISWSTVLAAETIHERYS